jgi:hypothetical protein
LVLVRCAHISSSRNSTLGFLTVRVLRSCAQQAAQIRTVAEAEALAEEQKAMARVKVRAGLCSARF